MRGAGGAATRARSLVGRSDRTAAGLAAFTLLVAGCSRRQAEEPLDLAPRIAAEAEALAARFSLGTLLTVLLVAFSAWLVTALLRLLVRGMWRLGFDTQRRLAVIRPRIQLGLIVAVLAWACGSAVRTAPTLSVLVFPLAALAVLWLFGRPLQNFAAGLWLILSHRIRVGDRIVVEQHEGLVEELGWGRVCLRGPGGVRVDLPARDIVSSRIEVSGARNTHPLVFDIPIGPGQGGGGSLQRVAVRLVKLCPYRVARTEVRVEERGERLRVRFHTWNEAAAELASELLREQLAQYTGSSPPARQPGEPSG